MTDASNPADGEANDSTQDEQLDEILRAVAHAPRHVPPPEPAHPGDRWGTGGRYVIGARLGRGGMGTVYSATDTLLHRTVALKVLDAGQGDGEAGHRARLLREARIAARFEHERVARVYDVGEHEGALFVAMELVRGVTLRRWMAGRAASADEILDVAGQIAEGLAALHAAGVFHRDLKPENVMLTEQGAVRLLDFGLARHTARSGAEGAAPTLPAFAQGESLAALSGTPGYMAPEQWAGEPLDARVDVFALGVILYELVTGARPFDGPGDALRAAPDFTHAAWTTMPAGLQAITARMLARDPADRFADGAAARDALSATTLEAAPAARSSTPGTARTPASLARTERTPSTDGTAIARTEIASPSADTPAPRRPGARAALSMAAVAVIATCAGLLAWRARRHPLDVPFPVVACAVFEGVSDGKPATWLGAAAAYDVCDDVAPMLGGFNDHVRYPAALLGIPALAPDDAPLDPWAAPDVRDRSLAAAKSAGDAWIDGRIEDHGGDFTLALVVHDRSGRELGRASADGRNLARVTLDAGRKLRASGALGPARGLEPDYRELRGVTSTAEDDALSDLFTVDPWAYSCNGVPGPDLSPLWASAYGRQCRGDAMDPTAPLLAWIMWRAGPLPPEVRARIERDFAATTRGEARAILLLRADYAETGRSSITLLQSKLLAASRLDARTAWRLAGDGDGANRKMATSIAAWAPESDSGWLALSRAAHADPTVSIDLLRRASFVGGSTSGSTLYARALLGQQRAREARSLAARLLLSDSSTTLDIGRVVWAQADACEGALERTLSQWTAELRAATVLFSADRFDNARLSSAREVAYVLGQEHALASVVAAAVAEGRTTIGAQGGNITAVPNTAALCALADRAAAIGCLVRLREIAPSFLAVEDTMAVIDVAEAYAAADFRGAAEKARGLLAEEWLKTRIGDFLVDVFDRGGLPDLAEELDRPRADDMELHGASLSTLRSARRAWARGDKPRARALARRVVDAWKLVDTTVPAVVEMEALLAAP